VADLFVVAATVFTHPFCPWCWAAEPQVRRPETEFGGGVAITFVIGRPAEPLGELAQPALDVLAQNAAMATPEVALVCDLPGPRAPAELWRRALDWRIRPRRVPGWEPWEPA
jgi:hypothetical protein